MKLKIFIFVLILLICCPVFANCESDGPFIVPAISPTPISTPSPTPVAYYYLIVINKELNTLTLFNYRMIIGVYSVATGKIENGKSLTPSGKFMVVKKVIDPYWGGGGYATPIPGGDPRNPLGHYWIGLSITPSGGDYGIHGNVAPDSIGSSVSHGCVRMRNDDVPVLFNMISIGTPVWIGTSKEINLWTDEYLGI